MASTTTAFKTLLKSGATFVVCLGLATAITPKPAQAGKTGAILFGVGAGIATGIIINEAIRNNRRQPRSAPPPRHYNKPARRVQPRAQYSRAEAMRIQTALNTLGYDAGTVDGIIGGGTRAAIRTFQIEIDQKPTGFLTGKQKTILYDRASVARASGTNQNAAFNNNQQNTSNNNNQQNTSFNNNQQNTQQNKKQLALQDPVASQPNANTQANNQNNTNTQSNQNTQTNQNVALNQNQATQTPTTNQNQATNQDTTQAPARVAVLNRRDVVKVQKSLNALGYPAGSPNGQLTEETREAIMAFQIDISHDATGNLTEDERDILFDDAADLASADTNDQNQANQNQPAADTENDNVSLLGSNDNVNSVDPSSNNVATDNLSLREYREISAITDPVDQLKAARNARRNPPGYVDDLSAAEKLQRESQLAQLEADVKHEMLTPVVEKADAAPVSLKGMRQIASLETDAQPIFALLGPAESKPYVSHLQSRQAKILDALVADQLDRLKSFPQNLDGLKQSARWYDRFMGSFADYSDQDVVIDALAEFTKDRSGKLTAAFPQFEQDVAGLSNPDAASELMADYLSWRGDQNLPISLEYKFVAAQQQ